MPVKAEILYISYDGLTDQLGQSQILPYLQGLSAKGYHITIVSCEKPAIYGQHFASVLQMVAAAGMTWQYVPYSHGIPVLSAIWNTIRLKKLCNKLYKTKPIQLVHCRSYLAAMIGLAMKKRYGCKFIFDMRGFWPDERVDGKLWNLANPVFKVVYNYFKKQEKRLLAEADHIVTLTQKAKEIIQAWKILPVGALHISVIPCCTDTEKFALSAIAEERKDAARKQLGVSQRELVLTYIGAIGTWYMLPEMLDFYTVLLKKYANCRFLFVTNENKNTILDIAKQKGVDIHKISIVSASRAEVPLFLSITDLAVFLSGPVFPSKPPRPLNWQN